MLFLQVDDQIGIIEDLKIDGLLCAGMVMVADNVAHLINQLRCCPQPGQHVPRYRRAFLLLIGGLITVVLALGLFNTVSSKDFPS
mgnify:CR=1 FL=1